MENTNIYKMKYPKGRYMAPGYTTKAQISQQPHVEQRRRKKYMDMC